MRTTGKARCFYPDYGVDATDSSQSLQKVFLNICGLIEASWQSLPGVSLLFLLSFMLSLIAQNYIQIGTCLVAGWPKPSIHSHFTEVKEVKSKWGNDTVCNIGV